MKTVIISLMLFWILISGTFSLYAQVAISTNGSPPDNSAMLDIKSGNKGLLMPRIDFNNRPANPAAGLLVYVTVNGPYGNGLYLFDGSGWVMISMSTFYPGQQAGGGTVFYVTPAGSHGLIVSPSDLGYFQWGCDTTLLGPPAQHTEIFTGDLNTAAIVAACPSLSNAAQVCDTLTAGGFTDWYLPSRDELDTLVVHQSLFGGLSPSDWYWSSSEQSKTGAYLMINDPYWFPFQVWTDKMAGLLTRCIRKF